MRRVALERMGHTTVPVDLMAIATSMPTLLRRIQWRLRAGPLVTRYNRELLGRLEQGGDLFWVEKGVFVRPETVAAARTRGMRAVLYSPDNYFIAQNASRHLSASYSHYDLVVTTKADKIAWLKAAGARAVLLSGNAYDPETHRQVPDSDPGRAAFACDVSFVGRWEPSREEWLVRVAAMGVDLSIRGIQWERARHPAVRRAIRSGPALALDYARAISAAKINLGLLSRLAGDTITQRSVEIPACGGFMLAERTPEHQAHFAEDREAVYFTGIEEMLEKIAHYLPRADGRARIAEAGRARCVTSGYSYDARMREILSAL